MKRILILCDPHVPFHSKLGWMIFLSVLALGWEEVIINGDFMDCLAVSFHPRNLSRRYVLAEEINIANRMLDELQDAAGSAKIVYIAGNHEHRMERYISEKAPELHGLEGTTIQGLLRLRERNIRWIPYKAAAYKVGKLAIVHDIGRAGVNTARQSLLDFGSNIVVGHSHRAGSAYQGTVRGEAHVGVNGGWLGDAIAADYTYADKAKRDWQLGLTSALIERSGNAHVQFHPIIGRSIYIRDKLVKV